MANKNTNLHKAKREKDDEFYTTYETIEKELSHYKEQFKDKVVLCNCDDPYHSNFCKYFIDYSNELKLKRLICTSYKNIELTYQPTLFDYDKPLPIPEKKNSRGLLLDLSAIDDNTRLNYHKQIETLNGNGDFRSAECIHYLKECDIVVTNPPFSLFKEFVSTILEYDKRFLIIGNQNALTYKEIFPLLQSNKIWTGYQFGEIKFRVPDSSWLVRPITVQTASTIFSHPY